MTCFCYSTRVGADVIVHLVPCGVHCSWDGSIPLNTPHGLNMLKCSLHRLVCYAYIFCVRTQLFACFVFICIAYKLAQELVLVHYVLGMEELPGTHHTGFVTYAQNMKPCICLFVLVLFCRLYKLIQACAFCGTLYVLCGAVCPEHTTWVL